MREPVMTKKPAVPSDIHKNVKENENNIKSIP